MKCHLLVLLSFIFLFSFSLTSATQSPWDYTPLGNITNIYENNTYINQTVELNTTQFETGEPVTIKTSWLSSFINSVVDLSNFFTKSEILAFSYYNSTSLQNLSQLDNDEGFIVNETDPLAYANNIDILRNSINPFGKAGTVVGGVTIDETEDAMVFDGTTGYIDVVGTSGVDYMDTSQPFTVTAWVKMNSFGTNQDIISRWTTVASKRNFGLLRLNNNRFVFRTSTDGTSASISSRSSASVYTDADWHFVVGRYNGTHTAIFVDGILGDDASVTDVFSASTVNIRLGGLGATVSYLNGSMATSHVYTRALTNAEITELYLAGKDAYAPKGTALLNQWSGRDYIGTPASPTTINDTSHIYGFGNLNEIYHRIQSDGGLIVDGSVGIGTTAPRSTNGGLDIASGGLSLILGADNVATTRTNANTKYSRIGAYHYTNAEEPMGVLLTDTTATENILHWGGGSGLINAATNHRFYTGATTTTTTGTERMRITSTGNVGIGNTAPSVALEIGTAGGTSRAMVIHGNVLTIARDMDDNSFGPTFIGQKKRTAAAVSNGDVLFQLSGYGWDGSAYKHGGVIAITATETYSSTTAAGSVTIGTTPSGSIGPVTRMIVNSAGNVGIGTTAPSQKLDVQGNGEINGTLITNSIASLTGENITFYNSTSNGYANLNVKSVNVFSPEDKNYDGDKLSLLPTSDKILGIDGKLSRTYLYRNERKDNQPIQDLTKPIYVNKTSESCEEVIDQEAVYEEVCTIEKPIEEPKEENPEGEIGEIKPEEPKETCEQVLIKEATYKTVCTPYEFEELVGYQTIYQNATDVGAMSFNNRLLITEVKEIIINILNRLTGAETKITSLENENTLIKSELCKVNNTYAWCKVVKD